MKASWLTLILALATTQIAPPTAPSQRGQSQPAIPLLTAAQCKCSIEVSVKRASTGEPLDDAEVILSLASGQNVFDIAGAPSVDAALLAAANARANPSETRNATSDVTGHAVFRDLAEGNYTITVQREGYFGPARLGNSPTLLSASVRVGPERPAPAGAAAVVARGGVSGVNTPNGIQPIQQVEFAMVAGGVISGRVQNANRRTVSGVSMAAFRVAYRNGHRTLNQIGNNVQTDDRGEYRLFYLPPGEYFVRTNAGPAAAIRNQGYPSSTFYPGTADPAMALPIVLQEGQERSGTDLITSPSTGVTVSGTIVNNVPGGRPGANGQVNRNASSIYFAPRNTSFWELPPLLPNINTARGAGADPNVSTFEIRNVPPGTYDFYPIFNDGNGIGTGYFSAHNVIEVGADNISNVVATIQPGVDLRAHLTVVGTAPSGAAAQAVNFQMIRLGLTAIDNLPSLVSISPSLANSTLDSEGKVLLTNLTDARYSISVNGIPQDAYVSELQLGTKSFYDDGFFAIGKATPDPLEIVVSRNGGVIQGTVIDARSNPVATIRVTLIPEAPRRGNTLLYKTATSNPMGKFSISGVAPGSYKLFAWEVGIPGAEQDPAFIRDYEVRGVRVVVGSGINSDGVQVPLILEKN